MNMRKTIFSLLSLLFLLTVLLSACGDDEAADPGSDAGDGSEGVATPSSAFDEFNSDAVTVSFDGDQITIHSTGVPDHTSPYFNPGNSLYIDPVVAAEASMSPGFITESSYTLTVSAAPELAASSTETGLGAIGISVSGAPIYNQSEGPTDVTAATASGFDWAGGHSGPTGYHYHVESRDVDANNGAMSYDDHQLVGIMSDGFLLYGRRESEGGDYPDDLDESGGHFGITPHSDVPIYHYHIVNELYINTYYLLFGVDLQGTPNVIM